MQKPNKDVIRGLTLDETDRENLERALKLYAAMNPRGKVFVHDEKNEETGEITRWVDYCNIQDYIENRKKEIDNTKKQLFKNSRGVSDRAFNVRASFPPGLAAHLQRGYPTLLTDEKQLDQFLKWFPYFDLGRN